MLTLAIESSCDETSASVVKNGVFVLSNIVSSSSRLFEETGGVVPEVAARKQVDYITPVIKNALEEAKVKIEDITNLAVTTGPGLVGSLLVGVNSAKTLSLLYNKPLISVNHLIGHIYSVFIKDYLGKKVQSRIPDLPNLSLIVSGGHTELVLLNKDGSILYLGGTRDDAAGEAFDKIARKLGISRYLGGAKISQVASESRGNYKFRFPRPMINSNDLDFSFSGLKTSVIRFLELDLRGKRLSNSMINNICREFENALVEVLLAKTLKAFEKYRPKSVSVVGGVSANSKIRKDFAKNFGNEKFFLPPLELCGDNAAMIGCAAFFKPNKATCIFCVDANPGLNLELLG